VVQAESAFDELRADRDAAVLDECLTPDSFRRFLHAILFDHAAPTHPSPPGGPIPSGGSQGTGPQGTAPAVFVETPLEDIMLACTEDPDRIVEIDQLLATFQRTAVATGEYRQFLQFWNVFKGACATVRKDLP
jgi:hypothetical protein